MPLLGGRNAHPLIVVEPAVETRESGAWQRLHPRTITLWRLQFAMGGLVIVALTITGAYLLHRIGSIGTAVAAGGGAVVVLVAVACVALLPPLAYEHWRYRLAADALELERGVLTRRRSVVPYGRVQQVDLTRGPIDRTLGLTAARLLTASSSTDGSVPGLSPDDAEAFRRLVLQRAGRDDAV